MSRCLEMIQVNVFFSVQKPTMSSDTSETLLDSLTLALNTMISETLTDDAVILEGRLNSVDRSYPKEGRGLVAVAVEPVARNQSSHTRVWFLDTADLPDDGDLGSALEVKILQWKEKVLHHSIFKCL